MLDINICKKCMHYGEDIGNLPSPYITNMTVCLNSTEELCAMLRKAHWCMLDYDSFVHNPDSMYLSVASGMDKPLEYYKQPLSDACPFYVEQVMSDMNSRRHDVEYGFLGWMKSLLTNRRVCQHCGMSIPNRRVCPNCGYVKFPVKRNWREQSEFSNNAIGITATIAIVLGFLSLLIKVLTDMYK